VVKSGESPLYLLPEALVAKIAAATPPTAWPGVRYVLDYDRVSTTDQRESRNSLRDQFRENLLRAYQHGLVHVGAAIDDHTGTEYTRPGLDGALAHVRAKQGSAHPVGGLLVWSMDRWGRRAIHGMAKALEATEAGASVLHMRYGRLRRADMEDPDEMSIAFEALRDAELQHRALHNNAQRGRLGDIREGRSYWPVDGPFYYTVEAQWGRKPVYLLQPRPDARERLGRIQEALAAAPTRETLGTLATELGLKPRELLTQLRDSTLLGHYHHGNLVTDAPIERLMLLTPAEYERLQDLLAPLHLPPTPREGAVLKAVQDSSIMYVPSTARATSPFAATKVPLQCHGVASPWTLGCSMTTTTVERTIGCAQMGTCTSFPTNVSSTRSRTASPRPAARATASSG